MFKLVLEKAEEPEIKLPASAGSSKKQESSRKNIYFCFIDLNFQMFKLVLEKAEEPEIKLPTFAGSSEKQESFRKTSTSALLIMPKYLTV